MRGGYERSVLYLCILLVFIAGIVRVAYHFDAAHHDPFYRLLPLGTDMRAYNDWARGIAEGDWLSRSAGSGSAFDDWVSGTNGVFTRAPLYAYFLAVLFRLVGPHLEGIYIVQQILGIGICLLLLSLGRILFSLRVGLTAGLVWALYGVGMVYEIKQLLATLLVFLIVLAALRIARGERSGRLRRLA